MLVVLFVYGDIKDDTDENGNEYKKYRKDENVIYRDVLVFGLR